MSSGGKRKGAGRPAAGTVRFEARVKPKTLRKIQRLAKEKTLGQWLDELVAA